MSEAAAWVKRSREMVFIETDALPPSEQFARSYQRSHGSSDAEPTRGQATSLGIIRTRTRGKGNKRQRYYGSEEMEKGQQIWV